MGGVERQRRGWLGSRVSTVIDRVVAVILTPAVNRAVDRRLPPFEIDKIRTSAFSRTLDDIHMRVMPDLVPNVEKRVTHEIWDRLIPRISGAIEGAAVVNEVRSAAHAAVDAELPLVIGEVRGELVAWAQQNGGALVEEQLREMLAERINRYLHETDILPLIHGAIREAVSAKVDKLAGHESPPEPLKPQRYARPHKEFDVVRKAVGYRRGGVVLRNGEKVHHTGLNILLQGEAGCGKSAIAGQLAAELDLPFWFNGPIQSEYKLIGYKDASGRYQSTAFREAFEKGGVYLFDEIDACDPRALVAFNGALAQGQCDFPDGPVQRHADFIAIAAANTFGRGATRLYAGRNQLDAATLDRFVVVQVEYDEELERAAAGNDKWVAKVQGWRAKLRTHPEARHVISMRASIDGAKLLAQGMPEKIVEKMVVWRGFDGNTVHKIIGAEALSKG